MGKLIDGDELSEAFRHDIMGGLNWERILREAKPVDAVPVVHGRWEIVDRLSDAERYRCSVCGQTWIFGLGDPQFNGMNFCPNCGAKMDGEQHD